MKRFLAGAFAALLSLSVAAATLNPIQLLNPAGSTSGQVIASTGASTPPAWTTVTLSGLSGIVAIANGGTGATSAATALANLGGLGTTAAASTYLTQTNASSTYATISNLALKSPIASPTFTGTVTIPAGASISGYLTSAAAASTYAPLVSPAMSGVPTAPTAIAGSNTTQLATTAFVLANSVTSSSPTITTPKIVGVTNGTAAVAGQVGEVLTGAGGPSAQPNGSTQSVGGVVLTPGVWDVQSIGSFVLTGATASGFFYGTSSTLNTYAQGFGSYVTAAGVNLSSSIFASPVVRYNVSVNTTVYGTGNITFSGGSVTLQTLTVARRVQ